MSVGLELNMDVIRSLDEANEVSAVRLVRKRQIAKVGDIFRLSPLENVFLWGRLIKRSNFFGLNAPFNLVYIYDAIGPERPRPELLSPSNLIIGACVVNNLGWARGYWEIVASEPVRPIDILDRHLFIRYRGTGSPHDFDTVDENGKIVKTQIADIRVLSQSGIGNFNLIDWQLRAILRDRQILPNQV
jgi:hypothetical protein